MAGPPSVLYCGVLWVVVMVAGRADGLREEDVGMGHEVSDGEGGG